MYQFRNGIQFSTFSQGTAPCKDGRHGIGGELDAIPELVHLADVLEQASLKTIESGKMTKDLALITSLPNPQVLNSSDFIKEIRKEVEAVL